MNARIMERILMTPLRNMFGWGELGDEDWRDWMDDLFKRRDRLSSTQKINGSWQSELQQRSSDSELIANLFLVYGFLFSAPIILLWGLLGINSDIVWMTQAVPFALFGCSISQCFRFQFSWRDMKKRKVRVSRLSVPRDYDLIVGSFMGLWFWHYVGDYNGWIPSFLSLQ